MIRFSDQLRAHNERLDSVMLRLDAIHTYVNGFPCPPPEGPAGERSSPVKPNGALPSLDDAIYAQQGKLTRIFDMLDALDKMLELPPTTFADGLGPKAGY